MLGFFICLSWLRSHLLRLVPALTRKTLYSFLWSRVQNSNVKDELDCAFFIVRSFKWPKVYLFFCCQLCLCDLEIIVSKYIWTFIGVIWNYTDVRRDRSKECCMIQSKIFKLLKDNSHDLIRHCNVGWSLFHDLDNFKLVQANCKKKDFVNKLNLLSL